MWCYVVKRHKCAYGNGRQVRAQDVFEVMYSRCSDLRLILPYGDKGVSYERLKSNNNYNGSFHRSAKQLKGYECALLTA